MKLYFEHISSALLEGIELLCEDLDIVLTNAAEADISVTVQEVQECVLTVSLCRDRSEIMFGGGKARFFRGLTTLAGWIHDGICDKKMTERPLFQSNGPMADLSAAVMRPEAVKMMLRKIAMMGMNMFLLYTEDTYEIEGRPYFGYMRGRYTAEEIRDMDAYAQLLGIELIPCVQMLGHLAGHLRWDAAAAYADTAEEMLVGAPETYALIEDMFKTIRNTYTTRRVHIGMDETHTLGTGQYLSRNGYRECEKLYFEHLERIREIARVYGLELMMWSDMFFRMAGKGLDDYKDYDRRVVITDTMKGKAPKDVQQVFWHYYTDDEQFYTANIQQHRLLFGKTPLFAGGVWCWSGLCPLYSRSLNYTKAGLNACRDENVKQVIATVWGGLEHSLVLSLPGLAWYADYDYKGYFDMDSIKTCFRYACGIDYDTVTKFELPEHPDGGLLSLGRAMLYNDPLLGLVDNHIGDLDTRTYYEEITAALRATPVNQGIFSLPLRVIADFSDLLIQKADFGVRLKTAYDADDRIALQNMITECDTVRKKLQALRESHRVAFLRDCKAQGWEVHDIRYGGLLMRFDTVKARLVAYLAGEISQIEELEEERLRLDGAFNNDAPRFHKRFLWLNYQDYASPRRI